MRMWEMMTARTMAGAVRLMLEVQYRMHRSCRHTHRSPSTTVGFAMGLRHSSGCPGCLSDSPGTARSHSYTRQRRSFELRRARSPMQARRT